MDQIYQNHSLIKCLPLWCYFALLVLHILPTLCKLGDSSPQNTTSFTTAFLLLQCAVSEYYKMHSTTPGQAKAQKVQATHPQFAVQFWAKIRAFSLPFCVTANLVVQYLELGLPQLCWLKLGFSLL